MSKLLYIPLLLFGLSITSTMFASERSDREGRIYVGFVGAGAGYFRISNDDLLNEDGALKGYGGAWQGYVGFDASRTLAFEAVYTDFGKVSDGRASTELTAVSVSMLLHLPLSESAAPYGKVGMMLWDRKRSFGSLSADDEGDDVFFGLGMRFSRGSNVDTRFEYERLAVGDTNVDMVSVKVQIRF